MYLKHWGLQMPPFRQPCGACRFYHGPVQEEALARLHFLVENRHPFGLVSGPAGSGKSLLLDVFAARTEKEGREPVHFNAQGIGLHELCWKLAVALKLAPATSESPFVLWRRICDRVDQFRLFERDVLLLLDDVDEAERDATTALVQLLSLNRSPQSRITLIITCRTENLAQLSPRILEQAELRIEVEPLNLRETAEYLHACLAHVGGKEAIFSNAAIGRLHELCGGIPRQINQLAELSLAAAASQKLACVDTETVELAARELHPGRRKAA